MRAVRIEQFGGPEQLQVVEIPRPEPEPGQVLIAVNRAGINFADTHQVEDTYLAPATLPLVPGGEVAGVDQSGRRVVALLQGGYAEYAIAPEQLTFPVPDDVNDAQALALVLQGATAWHLLRTSTVLREGESVVVHAAAGGVGTLAVQLAKSFGAGRVIATASTPEKRQLALDLGADVAVDPAAEGLRDRLVEANGGRPVDVVLEMTGGEVFAESLRALAPFGRLVTYGAASREMPQPIDPVKLMATSRTVAGFWLGHCFRRPEMIATALDELFALTGSGALRPVIGGEYPLSKVEQAHVDLRARRTVGKLVLDPSR